MIRLLSYSCHKQLEEEINKLIVQGMELKSISVYPMHDYYQGMSPPTICNSWTEYIAVMELKK